MSSLDDLGVYIFVRGDLPEEDQLVQASHAVLEMALLYDPAFARYRMVALDGGSSEKTFNRTRQKLNNFKIAHAEYSDPDHKDWGVTAIATIPLTQEEALPLRNYRLRRYSPPISMVVPSMASGEPSRHSSEKEHSVSNGEAAGSIPAVGSNFSAGPA